MGCNDCRLRRSLNPPALMRDGNKARTMETGASGIDTIKVLIAGPTHGIGGIVYYLLYYG